MQPIWQIVEFIPVTDMYKTFDGAIDFYPGENGVYIPLDFPYPYTGQNLMVTGFKEFPLTICWIVELEDNTDR